MGKNLKINMSQKKFLSRSWPLEGHQMFMPGAARHTAESALQAHLRLTNSWHSTPLASLEMTTSSGPPLKLHHNLTTTPTQSPRGTPNRCKSEDCSLQSCLQSSRIGSIRPQASSSHSGQTPVLRFLQHRELRVCICSSLTVCPPPPPTLSI